MHDLLPVRGSDARANRLHQLKSARRRHRAFFAHDVLQRFAVHELHHQKRHRAAHHAEIRDGNNVLMTNRGGGHRFLAKARDQIRIVAD